MFSNRAPTRDSPYVPIEQSISYSNSDTADRPRVPQPFQTVPHPSQLTQPNAARIGTAQQPSTAYPRYSNSYAYSSPEGVQNHDHGPPSNLSLLVALRSLNKKDKKRLYWILALAILGVILLILFEAYRSNFETWIQPATHWMTANDAWSWTIPTAVLIVLSFPPLFGHEIVMLFVGFAYPIGVGIGIACAGAILGEAACFVAFKYFFTSYVDKKIAQSVRWAATARVSQEAGFRGILIIRYSIVPPHLANPLFSCTGMPFWLYMSTVILSLPKTIVFVILSSPDLQNSTGAKVGKYAAITVLVLVTVFASRWIWRRGRVAIKDIEAERTRAQADGETYEMLAGQMRHREGLHNPGHEMRLPSDSYDNAEWNTHSVERGAHNPV